MTSPAWTAPSDILARLRRRWDRGDFLSMFASGMPWEPLAFGLRGPTARDIAAQLDEARAWVEQWRRAPHFRVEMKPVGGRLVGTNEVPGRACVDSYEHLWSTLGVRSQLRTFMSLLDTTKAKAPLIAAWMTDKPMEVLRHQAEWTSLTEVALWIHAHAGQEMYLRQVDVAGVDTKFIEGHRTILAALLDRQLPDERIDPACPPADFIGRYRFRRKPSYVRFRLLHAGTGFSEMSVRVPEFAALPPDEQTVFIVENETTYLAFPLIEDAIVIFGEGYGAGRLAPLRWLADKNLVYWGDIDTHGFAILNRLRRTFGHARSMLMDQKTLLAHENQWVLEPGPTIEHLELLHPEEARLYTALVEDSFGPSVRLEQERISFAAIVQATVAHLLIEDQ